MRAIWKGAISFGLVNIPIALYPAVRREELKFHLLRKTDLSPINNKRVAAKDGREVSWDQIVKGYEYDKGKFIVLKEEDFARVDVEATQTVDIIDFVNLEEVSPIYFHKPYYIAPQKGGDKAYVLLREALKETKKIGIAKVVIKTREYLAAVKPQGPGLMLELMHFADEMVDTKEFNIPKAQAAAGRRELQMAESLIASMSTPWEPEKYHDDYREALKEVIEEKVEHPEQPAAKAPPKLKATKVIDLVAVLQESLTHAKGQNGNGKHAASKTRGSSRSSSAAKKKSAKAASGGARRKKAA